MDIILKTAKRCTTKKETEDQTIRLLNYLKDRDETVLLLLQQIVNCKGLLTVKGLHNLLFEWNKELMLEFISEISVEKYMRIKK